MTRFQGFATKEEAKEFQKKNGGMLVGRESRIKQHQQYWKLAVDLGGMDPVKYPWCVQWNEKL